MNNSSILKYVPKNEQWKLKIRFLGNNIYPFYNRIHYFTIFTLINYHRYQILRHQIDLLIPKLSNLMARL